MPTTTILYREGNTTSPRMDNVRQQDITIYQNQGVSWVQTGTGGISTWSVDNGNLKMWSLPLGSAIPNQLQVVLDPNLANHYLWEPTQNMTLANYKLLLNQVAPWARIRMEETSKESTVLKPSAELSPAFASLSPKVARFLLMAVDAQIDQHKTLLETANEDDASDLGNDLTLYQMIQEQLQLSLAQISSPS